MEKLLTEAIEVYTEKKICVDPTGDGKASLRGWVRFIDKRSKEQKVERQKVERTIGRQ